MEKRFSKEEFNSIYNKVPRLCVDLVILKEDKILLTKRAISPWKGLWHFPGGTVFLGDSLEKTTKRVAKEELNAEIELIRPLEPMEFYSDEEGQKMSVSFAYLSKLKSSKIVLNEQATEYDFFSIGDIPKETISQHKELLKRIFQKQ